MFGGLKLRLSNLITLFLGVSLVGVMVLASFAFGGTLHKEDGITEEEDNLQNSSTSPQSWFWNG